MPTKTPAGNPASSLSDRYRVLLDIGRTLAGTLGIEELCRTIYRESARVLEAEGFYISVHDPDRDLATVIFYADRGEEREVSVSYPGVRSEVIRTGRASLVTDRLLTRSVILLGDADSELTRSAISAPLRHEGRVLGAISAQSYRPDAYDQEDVELLQGIADLAAVAIVNARYVAELRKKKREAERLEEIGRTLAGSLDVPKVLERVISAAIELLDAESATVWLVEEEMRDGGSRWVARIGGSTRDIGLPGGTLVLEGPLLDEVIARRRPLHLRDIPNTPVLPVSIRERFESEVGIVMPMLAGDRIIGALTLGRSEDRPFEEEEEVLLSRLANQAAISMENASLHQRLRNLSLTDPLTGLPNRRHLASVLERELAAAARGRKLALVLFDLDNFKGYNDALGHMAGDEVLRALGEILDQESRAMNVVARYGGDEFVSLLSGTGREGSEQHARRIRDAVARHPLLEPYGITISYGIAIFGEDGVTAEALLKAADHVLYRIKELRRIREQAEEARLRSLTNPLEES